MARSFNSRLQEQGVPFYRFNPQLEEVVPSGETDLIKLMAMLTKVRFALGIYTLRSRLCMFVCMYVCLFVCMCVYVFMCVCVCVCVLQTKLYMQAPIPDQKKSLLDELVQLFHMVAELHRKKVTHV